MKIKALVTMLVLGSSSIALADATPYAAPTVRDHRDFRPQPRPLPQPAPAPIQVAPVKPIAQFHGGFGWQRPARPVLLANDTRLTGRALIQVPTSTRAFTKLELRSNNGRTSIDRVMIVYGNGQRQVVQLGKVVNGNGSLTIDLAGGSRNIKSLMLIGNSGRRASIDVVAV
jgi:hypothetical protein